MIGERELKRLLAQAISFVGVSGIGWILDFLLYTGLGFTSSNLALNNTLSSWVGVTFVFIFATRKVFKNEGKIALPWKYLIYILYQCVLIFFISKVLSGINTVVITYISVGLILRFSSVISKVLVTPITMTLNFFVMKGVIEKL